MKCSMKKADSRQKGRTKGEETEMSVMVKVGKGQMRGDRGLMAIHICANIREEMCDSKGD